MGAGLVWALLARYCSRSRRPLIRLGPCGSGRQLGQRRQLLPVGVSRHRRARLSPRLPRCSPPEGGPVTLCTFILCPYGECLGVVFQVGSLWPSLAHRKLQSPGVESLAAVRATITS